MYVLNIFFNGQIDFIVTICKLNMLYIAAAFFSSVKAITVFEGERVYFRLNATSELNSMHSVEWRFKSRLLAILMTTGGNWTLDNRFQITENGSLVLEDACFQDAGDYICRVILTNGNIQEHNISLQVQSHNIS